MKSYRSLQYANLIYNTWSRIYISIPIPLNGIYIYFWTQLFLCHKCHVTNHSLELQEKWCHYTTNGTTTITNPFLVTTMSCNVKDGRQGKIQSISLFKGVVYPHIIPNFFLSSAEHQRWSFEQWFNCFVVHTMTKATLDPTDFHFTHTHIHTH